VTNSIKLVVIDYQSGNLRSVAKALESVGVSPVVTGKAAEIGAADAFDVPQQVQMHGELGRGLELE